jgi:hypothetical protein
VVTAIAANPERHMVVVATEAGRALYESLGFVAVSEARWYFRSAS